MPTNERSADSAYEEIAGLTGNRAELERQRYALIKAIRALKNVIEDTAIIFNEADPLARELADAVIALDARKSLLWMDIEKTDAGISRLTDLVQNGAYNG